MASRLDEVISAHSGEDSFEEALKLLVAKLVDEQERGPRSQFLGRVKQETVVERVDALLASAVKRWTGIMDGDAKTHLNATELMRVVEILRQASLLEDHLVGLDAIFEFIVGRVAKGAKGQYFTPRHVIAELTKMIGLRPGDQVVDPACGSGGFLRHALLEQPGCGTWGFDQDPRAVRVARVMMAASGHSTTSIMRADSLVRPGGNLFDEGGGAIEALMRPHARKFKGFDVVLTNPPFAGDVGKAFSESYDLARNRRVERDVLFIERCIELLKPGGKLCMVLPHNKVGGNQWSYARKWLLARAQIAAVVGLGRNTFQPHTSQKACVLIALKRSRVLAHFPNEETVFFISEKDGKDHRGRLQFVEDGSSIDHDLHLVTDVVAKHISEISAEA